MRGFFFFRVEFFFPFLHGQHSFKEISEYVAVIVGGQSLLSSRLALSLALVQVLDLLVAVMAFERVRWRLGGHRVERRGKEEKNEEDAFLSPSPPLMFRLCFRSFFFSALQKNLCSPHFRKNVTDFSSSAQTLRSPTSAPGTRRPSPRPCTTSREATAA